ncbi:restriction endonuclease subunit S [Acinetobacter schindleri]|nr:restriction endonuclease subunit S [Acinetobacter schindleri]QIC61300.1 restriction endonuclease subunit S [Acinetobacter schindleri]
MAAPKLRFKEFDGDLTESKLVELTLWASGGTPAKDIPEYWGDDIPLISGASMHTNQLYESDVKITRLGLQKGSKLAPKDSILILVRGSMLFNKIPMGITLGDVAFNQDVKCIRPKQELAPQFLFQWLHAKENTIQNKVTATGIGAGKLDTADLQNLKLYKPSSEEQAKIASFLSNVDEKISQLTQKHALLSQYKQGMMQKLFSQQLRFKADDGSEFGEWEEKLLSEIGSFKNGLNKDKESFGFGYPFVNLMDVFGKQIIETENLGLVDATSKDLENYDLRKGDVLFIRSSVKAEGVGQTALVINDIKKVVYSGFLIRFRDSYGLDLGFKKYCFMNNEFRLRLLAKSTTSANTNINQESLSALSIKVPCLEEQTKIANFLSAIDQKIEVVAQQIEQTKTWKKGLLQQMFV